MGSTATTRGDIWGVTVTPFDEFDYGQEYYTEVEIMNSNPIISSFEYLPNTPTTMDNISFNISTVDVDGDDVTINSVNWQDSSGSISSENTLDSSLTTTGGIYYAIITLDDGNGGMLTYTSASVEVVNSLPTAIIEITPTTAWAGVNLSLSAK